MNSIDHIKNVKQFWGFEGQFSTYLGVGYLVLGLSIIYTISLRIIQCLYSKTQNHEVKGSIRCHQLRRNRIHIAGFLKWLCVPLSSLNFTIVFIAF